MIWTRNISKMKKEIVGGKSLDLYIYVMKGEEARSYTGRICIIYSTLRPREV